MDDRFEKVDGYLFLSLGLTKQNAWAGPDHWKYKKSKGRVLETSSKLLHQSAYTFYYLF